VNIVKLQNDLKDLSDKQLLQSMQAGSAPQYLVLSEMQRRKKMREEANSKPQMPSSVAEDIMAPPQMPQGQGLASMPQAPVMAMASGGIVGFAEGRSVDREVRRKVESSDRQFDKDGNVILGPEVEVAGKIEQAVGANQILPSTAMQPGYEKYGAKNIFDLAEELGVDYGGKKDEETAKLLLANEMINDEFADRYQMAMANRFGEGKATTAYHAGPGRTARNKIGPATEDYVAKSEALKNQIMAERGLDTQTGLGAIAALGEGRGSYGPGEMTPTPAPSIPTQTTAEAIAALGESRGSYGPGEMTPTQITEMYGPSWADVPANSPLRAPKSYQGGEELDGEERILFYDQNGAYDARDLLGLQSGSPTIYENTTDPYNNNLPIRPTGDDGLMALAPKSPRGKVKGLLPGEKIVNAAERATAEDYELVEKPVTNEYGDYLASLESLPMMSASDAMAALGETRGSYGPGEMSPAKPSGDDPSLDFTEPPRRAYFEDADPMPGPAPKSNQFQRKFGAPGARPREDGGLLNLIDKVKSGTTANPAENAAVLAQLDAIEQSQANKDFMAGAQDRMDEIKRREGEVAQLPPAPETVTKASPKAEEGIAGINTQFTDDVKVVDDEEVNDKIKAARAAGDDELADFLIATGLGAMTSKNTSFLGALAEGGEKGLARLDKDKARALKAEEARLLEEGRMKRQKMAGEAGLESARMRGQYTYLASLSKQITKIDEDLNDLQIQAQPSVVKALEARREQLIKEAAELQRQLSGAEAPADPALGKKIA
jgi:hypothetical protein